MNKKIVKIEIVFEHIEPFIDKPIFVVKITLHRNGTVILEDKCKIRYEVDLPEIEWAMNALIELATNEKSREFVLYDDTIRTMIFYDELNNKTIYQGNLEIEGENHNSIDIIEAFIGRCKTRYKGTII